MTKLPMFVYDLSAGEIFEGYTRAVDLWHIRRSLVEVWSMEY